MSGFGKIFRGAAVALACLFFAGCFPSAEGNLDEQKDPHYLAGRTLVASQDFKGAIEEFEKALEVNPRSASAHFELGWLYEEHMKDFAAAIFHYERHLKYRPDSASAERARERIKACKMDLAKTEVLGPVTQAMQRDLERLNAENTLLRRQIDTLQSQAASRPAVIPSAPPVVSPHAASPGSEPLMRSSAPATPTPAPPRATKPPPAQKIHTVVSGETVASISRKYGIRLEKLLSANPSIDPRRLRVGQTLAIPNP